MADTIPARLYEQAKRLGSAPAYHIKQGAGWKAQSWKGFADEVTATGKALKALGVGTGAKVAILGFNRPEWTIFDIAAMCVGAAPAGIYTTCSPEEVAYIIGHSESPIALLENDDQWQKVKAQRENLPLLKHVVMMKGVTVDDPMCLTWEEFLERGSDVSDEDFQAEVDGLKPEQLATLIYTSGTTGPPKGVMLSHDNLSWTAGKALEITKTHRDDCSVSYLPLSHIAEQMFTIHVPLTCGSQVYYAESIDALPDNLKDVQPTVFFGVPRIWEKFYAGVNGKLKQATGVKASLVSWARGIGTRVSDVKSKGQEPTGLLGMQYKLANKLIFSKLKPAVGLGRGRVHVTGAAPISQEILEFFASLDIRVQEVYGQSEDTGPTSFNLADRFKFGTVGPVVSGVEVKIAEDGEICVKGRNVFLGYYKEPEATAETLQDGWLLSGDLGSFDEDGFLCITGRKKEIIITAGGKNITPKNIEGALKNHELVSEAVVIGDRRKYLVCLITIDPEAGAAVDSAPAHESKVIQEQIQALVDDINTKFAKVETVKKFTILHRQLTIEDGDLTPTMKVKRKKVNEHFADEIEAMYA